MPQSRIIPIVESDISQNPQESGGAFGGMLPGVASYVIQSGDVLPPWWSRSRDVELHRLAKDNNHLSGLTYLAATKLANIPVAFVPKDPTITSHVEASEEFNERVHLASEFGQTWRVAIKKFIEDYLVLDNGGFMEIMGDGPVDGPIMGMPHAVRHLDAINCMRTGDRTYPVKYNEDGKWYKYHWTRIIYMSQMPSGRSSMYGVGFSSLSRSFMLGQILKDQVVYKMEKMGSRPTSKLVIGRNMEANAMLKAFMIAEELMNELSLTRYGKVVFLGGQDVDAKAVDLNNFEVFDEEVGTLMAMYALAFIWGLDIRDLWPVTGSRGGEQIANMRARGRLPADFTADLSAQFDLKLCPPYLKTEFDFRDDEEDQQRALISDIRSRRLERMAKTNTLDNQSMWRLMVESGEMTREEFSRLQWQNGRLEDGSPIATLFFSNDSIIRALVTLDGVENPLYFNDNDPKIVIPAIEKKQADCYAVMAGTRSVSQQRRARQALAALDWLMLKYEEEPEPVPPELEAAVAAQEEEGGEEEEDDGTPEVETPEEESPEPEEEEESETPERRKEAWMVG